VKRSKTRVLKSKTIAAEQRALFEKRSRIEAKQLNAGMELQSSLKMSLNNICSITTSTLNGVLNSALYSAE